MQYNFERNDEFKVEVYDIDDDKNVNDTSSHDPLGHLQFTLHEIVTCVDQTMEKQLINPKKPNVKSFVKIAAEEVQDNANAEICCFEAVAKFNESSNLYFFIVYKAKGPGQYVPVYKSEVRRCANDGRVHWNMCTVGCTDLCNDNVDQDIRVEFFRSETSGKHKNLGQMTTNLGQLKCGQQSIEMPCSGKTQCTFDKVHFERRHSFLEYVFGGCDIDLSIAIDFTLSNGHPSNPDSLHYWDMSRN